MSRLWGVIAASIVAILSGCVLAIPVQAASASGTSLTTSPVAVDLVGAPGSSVSTVLQVQNNESAPVTVSVKLQTFTANGTNGQAQIEQPPASDPSPNWVHFSPTSFTAEPGVWNKVTMTIDLPSSAAYGYYYAVLFVPSATVTGAGNSNLTKFKGANAIFVLVDTKAGNEQRRLSIQSFSADKLVTDFLPTTFNITVHNDGNIFVVPRGYVYISRTLNGPVIDQLDINSGLGNVLPNSSRTFSVAWTNGFPAYLPKRVNGQVVSDSSGKPVTELDWNFSRITSFRIGNYYARLALVYNNGNRDVEAGTALSFWVIPWLMIGAALLGGVLMAFGLWSILRRAVALLKPRQGIGR